MTGVTELRNQDFATCALGTRRFHHRDAENTEEDWQISVSLCVGIVVSNAQVSGAPSLSKSL